MAPEDFRALTPLIHSHVNPYGSFELDMEKRLPLGQPVAVAVQVVDDSGTRTRATDGRVPDHRSAQMAPGDSLASSGPTEGDSLPAQSFSLLG